MKRSMKKTFKTQFLVILMAFCMVTLATAQDLPAPGTVINKSNIGQYKNLFPEEFVEAFVSGWELIDPLSITVAESAPNRVPAVFLEESQKSAGKYGIDADGYISGGPVEGIVGYPFPDVTPEDPDFANKFMWNYDYRYAMDDARAKFIQFEKRRGQKDVSSSTAAVTKAFFQNRMFDAPKPLMETSSMMRNAEIIHYLTPINQRNFLNLLIRYIDQYKQDTTYLYLPSMRRVLRGEAGERSTPIMSSTNSPDDFTGGFLGRIPEFSYNYIGKSKVLSLNKAKVGYGEMEAFIGAEYPPVESDGWEVRDVYIIDIVPKSPRYPQSKKRFYIDIESMHGVYAVSYDRSGKVWKIWQTSLVMESDGHGGTVPSFNSMLGADIQLGYAVNMFFEWKLNNNGLKEEDFSIANLRRIGR